VLVEHLGPERRLAFLFSSFKSPLYSPALVLSEEGRANDETDEQARHERQYRLSPRPPGRGLCNPGQCAVLSCVCAYVRIEFDEREGIPSVEEKALQDSAFWLWDQGVAR